MVIFGGTDQYRLKVTLVKVFEKNHYIRTPHRVAFESGMRGSLEKNFGRYNTILKGTA